MKPDLNNEEYPRLTPPNVVYEGKEALKKKPAVVIPMWTKVASAAAAVALMFVLLWPRQTRPELMMTAELPALAGMSLETQETGVLAQSQARLTLPRKVRKTLPIEPATVKETTSPVEEPQRLDMPMLAELSPVETPTLPSIRPQTTFLYGKDSDELMAFLAADDDTEYIPLARRGIFMITGGRYDSFMDIFREGLRHTKIELAQINVTLENRVADLKQTTIRD